MIREDLWSSAAGFGLSSRLPLNSSHVPHQPRRAAMVGCRVQAFVACERYGRLLLGHSHGEALVRPGDSALGERS